MSPAQFTQSVPNAIGANPILHPLARLDLLETFSIRPYAESNSGRDLAGIDSAREMRLFIKMVTRKGKSFVRLDIVHRQPGMLAEWEPAAKYRERFHCERLLGELRSIWARKRSSTSSKT
jgi:hypothetical protein